MLVAKDIDNVEHTLNRMEFNDAVKTLGVEIAPNGSMARQGRGFVTKYLYLGKTNKFRLTILTRYLGCSHYNLMAGSGISVACHMYGKKECPSPSLIGVL